ncbi:MAG: pyruvate, water dikinase, partial [Thermodesulfobacteriota bacterium]|nr:pyruvate, water dikinase [Thermodesulfobacteriota bacterium]
MAGFTTFFKKVFKGTDKPQESPEVLRSVFKVRYWSFKTLLNANNATLEIISDMERALEGTRGFGMAFVRANCTAVSVNVYKIIQNMNEISSNRYAPL